MVVVSSREFRANQRKYFDLALTNDVVITSRSHGSYRLVPVRESDTLIDQTTLEAKIRRGIEEYEQVGDVDKSGKLLVHRVIWCPHSVGVIVWRISLNEGTVLCGNGVDISIAIFLILLFISVEVAPCSLHIAQLFLGGEIASLPIAS